MYAGKTETLLSYASKYKAIGKKIININYEADKRYSNTQTVSHSGKAMDAIFCNELKNIKKKKHRQNYDESEVILINEGQFFKDLYEFCLQSVEIDNKRVIVCGLDLDYQRKPFENMTKILLLADDKIFLKDYCSECGKKGVIRKALFTKRLSTSDERILIGGSESYIPVCREHYLFE